MSILTVSSVETVPSYTELLHLRLTKSTFWVVTVWGPRHCSNPIVPCPLSLFLRETLVSSSYPVVPPPLPLSGQVTALPVHLGPLTKLLIRFALLFRHLQKFVNYTRINITKIFLPVLNDHLLRHTSFRISSHTHFDSYSNPLLVSKWPLTWRSPSFRPPTPPQLLPFSRFSNNSVP